MSFLRPEAVAVLTRWREVLTGAAIALFGIWVAFWGGPVFAMLGGIVALAGAGLAVIAWRRMRFARGAGAPGVVEVVEGQIGYLGPHGGGYVALSDLSEIALIYPGPGLRAWRLSRPDSTVLVVPTGASGAEALFDAFAGLPGLDAHTLLTALDAPMGVPRIVWRRPGKRRHLHLLH